MCQTFSTIKYLETCWLVHFFFQFKDIFRIFYLLFRLMLGALFYGVWWFILFAEPLNLLNMCIQLSDLDINIFDDNALGNC